MQGPENQSAVSLSFAGTLFPGDYQLGVNARSSGLGAGIPTASSGYSFTLEFAPVDGAAVPEPASMLLLGTGLAGMFGYRRASTRRRDLARGEGPATGSSKTT